MEQESAFIVAGTDGSDASKRALDWAVEYAGVVGARVDIVHAWSVPMLVPEVVPLTRNTAAYEVRARALLSDAVDSARFHAGDHAPTLRARLVEGEAALALASVSGSARQLVLGSHGRGFAGRALLGSVTDRCLSACTTPVTIVPDPISHDGGGVVVGVDGSADSQAALEFAMRDATALSEPLVVVWAYPPGGAITDFAANTDLGDFGRDLIEHMLKMATEAGAPMPRAVEVLPFPGRPASALVHRAMGAAELVVGYGGQRHGLAQMGSVSRRCVHHTMSVVTVVRARQD